MSHCIQGFKSFKQTVKTFEELGVSEPIRKAIEELGFEQPMPVQEQVIPYLLGNRNDVIALAQTGTGKTAAFGIPLLQRVDNKRKELQAIVLSPTRELCLQICDDINAFAKYIPHACHTCLWRCKHRGADPQPGTAHRLSWRRLEDSLTSCTVARSRPTMCTT